MSSCNYFPFFSLFLLNFLFNTPVITFSLTFSIPSIGSEDKSSFNVYGDVQISSEGLQLTPNSESSYNNAGRATYTELLHLWDAGSRKLENFNTHFSFVVESNSPIYGEGLAFFLADSRSMASSYGPGGYMGLIGNSSRAQAFLAIEFDLNWLDIWDQDTSPHVGININNITSAKTTYWNSLTNIKGQETDAWVIYYAGSYTLEVYFRVFNSSSNSFCTKNLRYEVDLRDYLPEFVTVGFSSSTSKALTQINYVKSWDFESTLYMIDHADQLSNANPPEHVLSIDLVMERLNPQRRELQFNDPPSPSPAEGPSFAPPVDGPSFAPPVDGPSFEPPADGPSFAPPVDGPSFEPPADGPSFTPPADGPSFAPPVDGPSFAPPADGPSFAPPADGPSFAPPADGPPFTPPADGPSFAPPADGPSFAPPADGPSLTPSVGRPSFSPPGGERTPIEPPPVGRPSFSPPVGERPPIKPLQAGGPSNPPPVPSVPGSDRMSSKHKKIIGWSVGILGLILTLLVAWFFWSKKKKRTAKNGGDPEIKTFPEPTTPLHEPITRPHPVDSGRPLMGQVFRHTAVFKMSMFGVWTSTEERCGKGSSHAWSSSVNITMSFRLYNT